MEELLAALDRFVRERDWDQFHDPKSLSMALIVEVAEIIEHFQWLSSSDSYNLTVEQRDAVAEEIGDVVLYLLLLARKFDINPLEAALSKLKKNQGRFPVDQYRGKHSKTP